MDSLNLDFRPMAAAFVLGASLVLLWKWWRNESDVFFFPDPKAPCTSFLRHLEGDTHYKCRRANCEYAHDEEITTSLMRIFMNLNAATDTIDLCIFDFTHNFLAEFLINASRRNIRVRIITDAHLDRQQQQRRAATGATYASALSASPDRAGGGDRQQGQNDQIPRLQEHGIQVRLVRPGVGAIPGIMHNKFVLIDSRCLLTGSFNWTHSAVLRNHEAVIKTNEGRIVNKFIKKFDQLWKQSDQRPPGPN